MIKIANILFFSHTLFLRYQKTWLFPSINHTYISNIGKRLRNCRNIALDFVGDDRSDSPGLNVKNGTTTLINSKTNQIIDCHVDHVALAGISVRMEKSRRIGITRKSLTTDRHVKIRSYLAKEHPDISH